MHARGALEAVETPAARAHGVQDTVDVDGVRGEGNDPEGVAEHVEVRDFFDADDDGAGGVENAGRCVEVAAFARADHGGPGGGDEGTGAAAGERGGEVEAAGPVGVDEVLEAAELEAPIQDDRGAFG